MNLVCSLFFIFSTYAGPAAVTSSLDPFAGETVNQNSTEPAPEEGVDYLSDAMAIPSDVQEIEKDEPVALFQTIAARTSNFRAHFNAIWPSCSQRCRPVNPWIDPDARHCAKASCHNSLQAVDVHQLSCGGKTVMPGSATFDRVAKCFSRLPGVQVFWKVPDHFNHFHLQFDGCNKKAGCSGTKKKKKK